MKILIPVQKVAPVIGENKYIPRDDVFAELFKKYAPKEYYQKFSDQDAQRIILTNEMVGFIYQTSISTVREQKDNFPFANFKEIIYEQQLSVLEKDNLVEFFRRQMNRARGIPIELEQNLKPKNQRKMTHPNLEVSRIRDNTYIVIGKKYVLEDDEDGEKRLVENKSRMTQLYQIIPQYEYIELQASLQLLGIKNARFIQNFKRRTKEHDVIRNDDLWNDRVLPKIQQFCQELDSQLK